jgi:hypothetical protein
VISGSTRGRPPETGAFSSWPSSAAGSAFRRAAQDGYFTWLDHIWPAAGCTRPVRLHGSIRRIGTATGEVLWAVGHRPPAGWGDLQAVRQPPRHRLPVLRRNLPAGRLPGDPVGPGRGQGHPQTVTAHPAVFATFTAPSFGLVHTRVIRTHACADRSHRTCLALPCHARRGAALCPHGQPLACAMRPATGRSASRCGRTATTMPPASCGTTRPVSCGGAPSRPPNGT